MKTLSDQHIEAMLVHHGQQFERHAAGPLGSDLPLLHHSLAGIEVACKHRRADMGALADPLDLLRGNPQGRRETRRVKESRMVALSTVRARCRPWAALWIASKASVLN